MLALGEASKGHGSLVLVRGLPGVGKTRFIDDIRNEAQRHGNLFSYAMNYAGCRSPFGPFADIVSDLRTRSRELMPKSPAERLALERFIGETPATPGDIDRRRLFVVLADAFARAATASPICIAIDDMQWADPETIEFLHFWAARIANTRVSAFCALRRGDDEVHSEEELAGSLARFSAVKTIEIAPLDERSTRAFIASATPVGRTLPRSTVEEIVRLSEGNPHFLTDLIRVALSGDGSIDLPPNLAQSTRKRLRGIAKSSARLLEIASVIGRSFELDELCAIAEIERTTALAALREARDAALVDEDGNGITCFAFMSEIVRRVIYDTMFAAERASIHERVAARAEALNAPPEILAFHWRKAGDTERTARYAEEAGHSAHALGAFASARANYDQALAHASEDDHRERLSTTLARVTMLLGDPDAARAHTETSIELARKRNDHAATATLEALASDAAYRCGDVEAAIVSSERVLASPAVSDGQRFDAHVALATIYAYRPDIARAREHLASADRITTERRPVEEVRLEWARAMIAFESASDESWLAPAERSVAIATKTAEPAIAAYTLMNFAGMARESCRADLSKPALAQAISLSDRQGLVLASCLARCEAIDGAYNNGRLEEALSWYLDIIAMHVDAPLVRVVAAGNILPVLVDLGQTDRFPGVYDPELVAIAYEMREPIRFAPLAAGLAYAAAMRGNDAAARDLIDRAIAEIQSTRYVANALLFFARFGSANALERVRELLETDRSRHCTDLHRAIVAALIAERAGNHKKAHEAGHVAIIEARRVGMPLWGAYAYELIGQHAEALAEYERCGAVAYIRRLGTKKAGSFTKRETEVADLLKAGLSNRRISEKLVLSERTVENHVASVFAKSGVHTRAEYMSALIGSPRV